MATVRSKEQLAKTKLLHFRPVRMMFSSEE